MKPKKTVKISKLSTVTGDVLKTDDEVKKQLASEFIVQNSSSGVSLCLADIKDYETKYLSLKMDTLEDNLAVSKIEVKSAIKYVKKGRKTESNILKTIYKKFS